MIVRPTIDETLGRTDLADLIISLGVKLRKSGSNHIGLCPFHDDRSPSFSVIDDQQFYYCHGCGATGDAIAFLMSHEGLSFPEAFKRLSGAAGVGLAENLKGRNDAPGKRVTDRPVPRLASSYVAFHQSLGPPRGTVAEDYLVSRGCVVPPDDGDLRFARELRHPSGHIGPAIVALVTHAVTREPMTLHRTWIKPDGTKADLDKPRLLLGQHQKRCGVIRLWPDEAVTQGLAIAEGIETALTVAHAFTPVWSVIDAGNMAVFPVLDGITSLLIAADHDDAGLRGAEQCAAHWYAAGVEVRIAKSPNKGQDLNDFARAA